MNIRHLEFLCSVVEQASFTKAAVRHGVSQAAITLAMQGLERDLGVPLFERQGFRKRPTERALALARAGAGIVASMRRLPQTGAEPVERVVERPALKVGLAPAAGLLYGPVIHAALLASEPARLLSVITGPAPVMLEQLQRGALDIVIAPLPRRFPTKTLHKQMMYVGDPVIYARVGHPLQAARTLADVAQADWVVAGAAGTPGNVIEEAFRVRRWTPPRIAVQCPDYRMLLRLIAGSDLLGVVSNASLVSDNERGLIQPLSIREGLPRYDVCMFWKRSPGASAGTGARAVIEALAQHDPTG